MYEAPKFFVMSKKTNTPNGVITAQVTFVLVIPVQLMRIFGRINYPEQLPGAATMSAPLAPHTAPGANTVNSAEPRRRGILLGKRPVSSAPTNAYGGKDYPGGMWIHRRVYRSVVGTLLNSIPYDTNLANLAVSHTNNMGFVPQRLVKWVSPDVLNEQTKAALRSSFNQGKRLKALLSSDEPLSPGMLREIYGIAREGGANRLKAFWDAVLEHCPREERQRTLNDIQHLIERGDLTPGQFESLNRLDVARKLAMKEGREFDASAFQDILFGRDPENENQSVMHSVVERVRDHVLIDLLLEQGTGLDAKDAQGKTAENIAAENGEHALAAKLLLARNYQQASLEAGGTGVPPRCAVAVYQYDEAEMALADAEKAFYEQINRSRNIYTHGYIVQCRNGGSLMDKLTLRRDGGVCAKLIHSPCVLNNRADVTTLSGSGDCLIPASRKLVSDMGVEERKQRPAVLTRRPLHQGGAVSKYAKVEEKCDTRVNKLLWGAIKGSMAVAFTCAEGAPSMGAGAFTAAMIGFMRTPDEKANTVEMISMCAGGVAGLLAFGSPVAGTYVGGALGRALHMSGFAGAEALGEEFVDCKGVVNAALLLGTTLCVFPVSQFYRWYVASGAVISMAAFCRVWASSKAFRVATMCMAVSATGGTIAVGILGVPTWLATIGGYAVSVNSLMAINVAGGLMIGCDWDLSKLASVVPASWHCVRRFFGGMNTTLSKIDNRLQSRGSEINSYASLSSEEQEEQSTRLDLMFRNRSSAKASSVMSNAETLSLDSDDDESDVDPVEQSVSGDESLFHSGLFDESICEEDSDDEEPDDEEPDDEEPVEELSDEERLRREFESEIPVMESTPTTQLRLFKDSQPSFIRDTRGNEEDDLLLRRKKRKTAQTSQKTKR